MTMDPTPDHLDPDHLDDGMLSALLDGEAGDASDAAAHLGACDRCAARQTELAGARTALAGAPVEPLDELTRRRLVSAALPAARRRWAQRHPALVGSAAAVLLAVLVGVPFALDHGGSDAGQSLTAAGPEAARNSAAGPFLGDLGDLGDRDQLRLRLGGAGEGSVGATPPAEPGPSPASGAPAPAAPVTAAPVPAAAPVGATKSAGPAADTYASSEPTTTADRDRADVDTCVAALLDGPARGGRLSRSGVGTYRGRPAVISAFELSGGTVAFVTDRSGCAVLDRFPY
jgi:hypothetical protein